MKTPPIVLIFAATDGTGGAGVLADCRTAAVAGTQPLAIITGITAQNLDGVVNFWRTPAAQVRAQFAALYKAPIAAVKIGVVGDAAATIAACLQQLGDIPIVWDPILSPTDGAPFVQQRHINNICRHLLPRATIITPNRQELAILSASDDVAEGAHILTAAGADMVLVTDVGGGAHVRHELYAANHCRPLWRGRCWRRRGDYHGSGCLLATVLAARLAAGDLPIAAAAAAHKAVLLAMSRARTIPELGRQKLIS